ncbi:MAG: M23 family metallopeptidase [Proteobacteria bacterium]|nr:M23 family metallopeptidase [Pseudomonadota bacterium]
MWRTRHILLLLLLLSGGGCSLHSAPPFYPTLYEVSQGDTVPALAARFSLAADTIADLNEIPPSGKLRAGTVLQLPELLQDEAIYGTVRTVSAKPHQGAVRRVELGRARRYVSRLAWPIRAARFSSPFGARKSSFHEGVDLSAAEGTAILAAHDGEVVFAGRGLTGYGKLVVLQTDGLATVYAHNSSNLVETGERVRAGQKIARVGQTGDATGPHLHFEIRVQDDQKRYVAVDPLVFYRRVESRSQIASARDPGRDRRKKG